MGADIQQNATLCQACPGFKWYLKTPFGATLFTLDSSLSVRTVIIGLDPIISHKPLSYSLPKQDNAVTCFLSEQCCPKGCLLLFTFFIINFYSIRMLAGSAAGLSQKRHIE